MRKLLMTAIIICFCASNGCDENIKWDVINKSWQKVIQITGISPSTPMPQVAFLRDESFSAYRGNEISDAMVKVLGRAFIGQNRIEIYTENIDSALWTWSNHYERYGIQFTYEEKEIYFYSVVAHEFIHIALHEKGIDSLDHHQIIKNYEPQTIEFIAKEMGAEDCSLIKQMKERAAEQWIKDDELKKKKRSGMSYLEFESFSLAFLGNEDLIVFIE